MAMLPNRANARIKPFKVVRSIGGGSSGPTFDPNNPLLRWEPPTQTSPTSYSVGSGFWNNGGVALGDDEDAIITSSVQGNVGSDMEINGGRHIRLIGVSRRGRITVKNNKGSVYLEGCVVDLSSTTNGRDAYNIYGAPGYTPDVYFQNCIGTGVMGTNGGAHGDIYQPQGPIGNLYIDKFTGDSNYQGFFLRPEFAISSVHLSRVNLSFNDLTALGPDNNTYLLWLRNDASQPAVGNPLYPVELTDVYIAAHEQHSPSRAAVYPFDTDVRGLAAGVDVGIRDDSGNVTFIPAMNVTGQVTMGAPGSNYVTAGNIGVGYTKASSYQIPYTAPPASNALVVSYSGTSTTEVRDGWAYFIATTSGTLTRVSGSSNSVEALMIGGGGSGGRGASGGGSAGQLLGIASPISLSIDETNNSFDLVIGAGAPRQTTAASNGTSGGDTTGFGHIAYGGVGGSRDTSSNGIDGPNGGGAAGATTTGVVRTGGAATDPNGYRGGNAYGNTTLANRAQGGGAGVAGQGVDAAFQKSGAGGPGLNLKSWLNSSSDYWIGEGGGGFEYYTANLTTQTNGGGTGGQQSPSVVQATDATTAGSGGAGGNGLYGSAGFRGAIFLRWPIV